MSVNDDNRKSQMNLIDISFIVDDMWKGLKRYFWLLIICVVIFSGAVYFLAKKTYSPCYIAYSTFSVNTHNAIGYDDTFYNQTTTAQLAEALPYILTSDALGEMVKKDLGTSSVEGTIETESVEGTNLLTIKVESEKPQMAYDILQSVLNNYPAIAEYIVGDTVLKTVDESDVPSTPSNPVNFRNKAIKGGILGVIVFVAFLLIYAMTRNSVRNESDLKRYLNIECLGVLPRVKFKKRSKRSIQGNPDEERILLNNRRIPHAFLEASRNMRTRVEKALEKENIKTILVTSAIVNEGKSTVSANLALSLSATGKNVILLDADLRNPSIADVLGMKSEYSIKDVLEEKIDISKAITQYRNTRLGVILGGTPVGKASKLLSDGKMEKCISELKEIADYVIVDAPPSAILSDASILAQYVDAAIFVVRQDYATLDHIYEGLEMLKDNDLLIAGCVLNDAEVGITGYGYGQSYGYGRYGYGYGNTSYGSYGRYGYEADHYDDSERTFYDKTSVNSMANGSDKDSENVTPVEDVKKESEQVQVASEEKAMDTSETVNEGSNAEQNEQVTEENHSEEPESIKEESVEQSEEENEKAEKTEEISENKENHIEESKEDSESVEEDKTENMSEEDLDDEEDEEEYFDEEEMEEEPPEYLDEEQTIRIIRLD